MAGSSVAAPSTSVVISQVYGGGGNSGSAFSHDFVELHNISNAPQDVGGWSIQYSPASAGTWSVAPLPEETTIPAGGYYLIQLAAGNTPSAALPDPDATGTLNLSATSGKVALASIATALDHIDPAGPGVVDLVGYGSTNASEGPAAPAPGNATSISRKDRGSLDTDSNSTDFETLHPPAPRNGSTAPYVPEVVPDTPGPTVVMMVPGNGSTDVPLDQEITLTFTENILPTEDGAIHLRNLSTNEVIRSFDINANFGDVILLENSNAITLLSAGTLEAAATYYIDLPGGIFEDEEGNPSDAFGDPETSAFTTDSTPPAVNLLVPANHATNAASSGGLRIHFTEAITVGSGNITIRDSNDGAVVESIAVTSEAVVVEDFAVTIQRSVPLAAGETYHVEVDAGAFLDLAGFPFAGISGSGTWSFSVSTPPVVINKYYNAATDLIELLATGDLVPGSTVDMRGMILKDCSGSMGGDGGGKFELTQDPLWSAVPVGTLIVVSDTDASEDVSITDESPFTLRLGLGDPTYFTLLGGGFDIATTELVMIKAAGSPAAGVDGGIHAFGAGEPGTQFHLFGGSKLLGTATTGSNRGAYANNPSSDITDFSGSEVTSGEDILGLFGQPNNGTNGAFIAMLRGLDVSQGNGEASLVNSTPGSPFDGTDIFGRGKAGRSATITLTANAPGVTLATATLEIPSALGTPTTNNVSISGPGAAGASVSVAGQTITVSSAAVTTGDPLVTTIDGLSTPQPTGVDADGIYPIIISTTGSENPVMPIALQPALRVVVPIESLRDIEANGVAVDAGKRVAVQGVVTEGNFDLSHTSAFIQDESAGINLFSFDVQPELGRGQVVAVAGTVTTFRGLTEIVFDKPGDVVPLGMAAEREPITVPVANLLANPEAHEGLLVRVQNLVRNPDSSTLWIPGANIPMTGAGGAGITVRIQAASTAYPQPDFPATITGIWGQFAQPAAPFSGGYQLMPRDPDDFEPGELPNGGYAGWTTAHGIEGDLPEGDPDDDGLPNLVEYALGLDPTKPDSPVGVFKNGTLSFAKGSEAAAVGDVSYAIEVSTSLEPDSWTTVTPTINDASTISYPLPAAEGKVFARLVVALE